MENEADTVGIMEDDAVGMDDDSEDELLEGKDFYGFIRRRCVHAFVLLQDKVNNYLRVKNANRMKANKVRNVESR